MSHNMFGELLHKDLFETNAISVVYSWMDKENRGKSLPIEAVLILFSAGYLTVFFTRNILNMTYNWFFFYIRSYLISVCSMGVCRSC